MLLNDAIDACATPARAHNLMASQALQTTLVAVFKPRPCPTLPTTASVVPAVHGAPAGAARHHRAGATGRASTLRAATLQLLGRDTKLPIRTCNDSSAAAHSLPNPERHRARWNGAMLSGRGSGLWPLIAKIDARDSNLSKMRCAWTAQQLGYARVIGNWLRLDTVCPRPCRGHTWLSSRCALTVAPLHPTREITLA